MSLALVPASGALLDEILDETYPLWGEGLDRRAYAKYNEAQLRTPWGATRLTRVALVENGRVLSSAKRYDLGLRMDGQETRLIGIGAVFTPGEMRGLGYATELIRRVLEGAAGEGFGHAMLFSEIDPRYYERLGFRALPINQLALDVLPGRHRGSPAIPMRWGEFTDLPAIVEMNATQTSGFRMALVRDRGYVRQAITKKRLLAACGRPGHRKVEFFVVEEGGRAAAYVVLLEVADYWMITECGDRDPSGARVGAMLQALVAREEPHAFHLRAWFPPGFLPPQLRVVAHEIPPVAMMLRPIGREVRPDPPLTLQDIAWWHGDAF
ncbi:MAG TPA: GNAT family N-acetyltransferase [Vicinamibacterales bacterium]|jgi:GNAT superfamily N-acetyltransferase